MLFSIWMSRAEAQQRVLDIIAEKNPTLTNDERAVVARQVGLGALNYALLSVDNTKEIVFDWDRALSFEGQAGPYIQNAHVRASSILRNSDGWPMAQASTMSCSRWNQS